MKILQVSDIHGSIPAAEKIAEKVRRGDYELVIAAGDITNFGTLSQADAILGRIAEAGVKVLFVAGNCDPRAMLTWQPDNENIINLHLKKIEIGELSFIGLAGGGPKSVGTIIEFNEEQFKGLLDEIPQPSGRFILVSHTPPYGSDADKIGGKHAGSKSIREYVEKTKPILVSCGHLHEARAVSKIGDTTIVNAGPAREGNCASIIITTNRVEATLEKL